MPKDRTGQIEWTTLPPTNGDRIGIPIWRVTARGHHAVVVLSRSMIGCYTHYWHGRTSPCQGDNCAACDDSNARRWHGWLLTLDDQSRRRGILELTAAAAETLITLETRLVNLRGLHLELFRAPAKANGRVIVQMLLPSETDDGLPPPIEIQPILAKMWETKSHRTLDTPPPASEQSGTHQAHPERTNGAQRAG